MASVSIIEAARTNFHQSLNDILSLSDSGVPSNADSGNKMSIKIASNLAWMLGVSSTQKKVTGQTLGIRFEQEVADFLQATFPHLGHIRPGDWHIRRIGDNSQPGYTTRKERLAGAVYEQYEHLDTLESIVKNNSVMQATLGNAYSIAPDVVITRAPISDAEINNKQFLIDDKWGKHAAIRSAVQGRRLLHAVVSCKWTIRSDRAQNSRSEALNLLRNRKGRAPHIVVVTAEPMPSRIASLALGTGDIDCVYHFALAELLDSVNAVGSDRDKDMVNMMVDGKRLKDISDLPFDLSI